MVKGLNELVGHAIVDVVQRENPVAQKLVQIWALQSRTCKNGLNNYSSEITLAATIALRQEAISAMAKDV